MTSPYRALAVAMIAEFRWQAGYRGCTREEAMDLAAKFQRDMESIDGSLKAKKWLEGFRGRKA